MDELFKKCDEIFETLYKKEKYEDAFNEFLKIANETHFPLAEFMTGYFYLNGIGTIKDPDKAFSYTQQAAYHNERDAMYFLGYMYENGISQGRDIVEALKWYKAAAKLGQEEAKEKCAVFKQEYEEEDDSLDPGKYMYD